MDPLNEDILRRAQFYMERYGISLDRRLGFGKDGTVWESGGIAAVKVFRGPEPFGRELATYRRLAEHQIVAIRGHNVPQLLRHDSELLAIEMTIVTPPFVLDFGSAYVDEEPPEFPEEVMEHWLAEKRFGARWPDAAAIVSVLKRHGVHMLDIHSGNICFE